MPDPTIDYPSGTNWTWTATPPTLTLAGYDAGAIHIDCALADPVKIAFSGSNRVAATGADGIYCAGGLTIDGGGTLAVTSDRPGVYASGPLTISGSGTVNAGSNVGSAIWGGQGVSITGGATVSATASGANGAGISAPYDAAITIDTTGTVTATATATGGRALGGGGSISIVKGTVNVSSAAPGARSIPIGGGRNLTVGSGATLNNLAGTIKNGSASAGAGTITIANGGTINNSGIIDNTQSGSTITNNGTINSNAAGAITGNPPTGVGSVQVKTIAVGTQSGTLTRGTAGDASFVVTTANIAAGSQPLTLVGTIPDGVTADATIAIASDAGTFQIHTTAATPAGTHPLRVMIDSMVSAQTFDLVVKSPGGSGDGDTNPTPPTPPSPSAKSTDVTSVSVKIGDTTSEGTVSGDQITLNVPAGTDVSSMDIEIKGYPGATVTPAPPYDCSNGPVKITVKSPNGSTTKDYTITVNVADPQPVATTILNALAANCTAVLTQNADGTWGVEILIPFDAGFTPTEIETIAAALSGLTGVRFYYVDENGASTEISTRRAGEKYLKIAGTAADKAALANVVLSSVSVWKKNDATEYRQNVSLKLADVPGGKPAESSGGSGGSGGCDTFGSFILIALAGGVALRRKR